ncbi:MAG: 50S ribosomal protein L3, partial [Patescibacteria group bacterium]
MKAILARKLQMSQIFDRDGNRIPVTILEAGPVVVTQVKTQEKDGYEAVQVGFGKRRTTKKPLRGVLKGTSMEATGARWVRELSVPVAGVERGATIDVGIFSEGDEVSVSGVTKGRGFQGGVKRHGFHGQSKTHGTKHAHRQPGSISGPGRVGGGKVPKGKRMAGRMGGERVTVRGLTVVKIDAE